MILRTSIDTWPLPRTPASPLTSINIVLGLWLGFSLDTKATYRGPCPELQCPMDKRRGILPLCFPLACFFFRVCGISWQQPPPWWENMCLLFEECAVYSWGRLTTHWHNYRVSVGDECPDGSTSQARLPNLFLLGFCTLVLQIGKVALVKWFSF